MADSEEDPELIATLKRSVEEKSREDEQIAKALRESLHIQSQGVEDPQLARALFESTQDMAEEHESRTCRSSEESKLISTDSANGLDKEEDDEVAVALEESRRTFESQQARLLAEYERVRVRHNPDSSSSAAAATHLRRNVADSHSSGKEDKLLDGRRRVYMGALNSDKPLSRAEKTALSMDYGGNLDACHARKSTYSRTNLSARDPEASRRCGGGSASSLASNVRQNSKRGTGEAESGQSTENKSNSVVIDGQNVACEFGGGRNFFSSRGLELALNFYKKRCIHAVAIVPRHRLYTSPQNRNNVADDVPLLLSLVRSGQVFLSPPTCHDDYFILQHAMEKGAFVVSNDQFREMPGLQIESSNRQHVSAFLQSMRIPFMFVDGQFLPAPTPGHLGHR